MSNLIDDASWAYIEFLARKLAHTMALMEDQSPFVGKILGDTHSGVVLFFTEEKSRDRFFGYLYKTFGCDDEEKSGDEILINRLENIGVSISIMKGHHNKRCIFLPSSPIILNPLDNMVSKIISIQQLPWYRKVETKNTQGEKVTYSMNQWLNFSEQSSEMFVLRILLFPKKSFKDKNKLFKIGFMSRILTMLIKAVMEKHIPIYKQIVLKKVA